MAELKTKENDASVSDFIDSIVDEEKRNDCIQVLSLMKKVTRKEPKMWGASMVGFGTYHYVYASGRQGDWFVTGFAPRKNDLTLYIMPGFSECSELLEQLGKYKLGKSCLYLKNLKNIDLKILEKLIRQSVKEMKKKYKCS